MKKATELFNPNTLTAEEIQTAWEDAYTRFEPPEEEIAKFVGRLKKLGAQSWKREAEIVDIFSGRCNGIRALEKLGFINIEGVDISPNLLAQYTGKAKLYVADCRKLPFENESRDLIIVQGGLHHLPELPADLAQTFAEIRRVLRKDGKFVMVEPWNTPFLRLIHFISEQKIVRRFSGKFDAFATMVHYEKETYYNWLNRAGEVEKLLDKYFTPIFKQKTLGKLYFVGK